MSARRLLRGIAIALIAPTVGEALKFFYTLLSVSLFVPVVAGLASRRTGAFEVLVQRYPNSEYVTESYLRIGDALFSQKKFDEAKAMSAASSHPAWAE